jgi:hypothetical protein
MVSAKWSAMEYKMKSYWSLLWWAIMIVFICHVSAKADDYSFKYGMGLFNGEKTGSIKIFSIREESRWVGPLYTAREAGLWVDNISDDRSGAAFGKYQMGVKPGPDYGLYAKAFWGVQLQSSTDSQLGGIAQFSQDAGLGLRDETSFVDFLTLCAGIRF